MDRRVRKIELCDVQTVDTTATWRGVGTSMLPFVLPGSRLHLLHRGSEGWAVKEGDIVGFIGGAGRLVAHRVVEIVEGDGGRSYQIAGDTRGEREVVKESEIASVITRVETNLFSYDTDGPVGRTFTRLSLARSVPFLGALAAARIGLRAYSIASRLGLQGPIKRLIVGVDKPCPTTNATGVVHDDVVRGRSR